jgi:hypothetical protein
MKKQSLEFMILTFYENPFETMEDGRSTSLYSLYGQLSQGRMADFPALIASKSFDL